MWVRGNFLTPELHRKMGRLVSILNSVPHVHWQNKSRSTTTTKSAGLSQEAVSLDVTETK